MKKASSHRSRLLEAWLLATAAIGGTVCAQEVARPKPPDLAPRMDQLQAIQIELEFEQALNSKSRQKLHDRFESYLNSQVDKLVRRHGLSALQKKKLLLAGRVDIMRFLDRLEELENKTRLDQNDAAERWKTAAEINGLVLLSGADLFDDRSFFAKVVENTLTRDQAARYRLVERELVVKRHRATLEWVLGTWVQTFGLSTDQQRRLKVLLIEETRPPKRFGSDDYYGVLCQVARIPEEKIKSIFNDKQWAKLQSEFTQVKQMEPMLRQNGYVPEQEVAVAPGSGNAPEKRFQKTQG